MVIKKGMKRVCADIPEEMHNKITQFNKISARPVNMSRVMELALNDEISKINTEILEYVKKKGAEAILSDIFYEGVLSEVKSKSSPSKIQHDVVKNLKDNHYDSGLIGIYPVNKIEVNEETKEILFLNYDLCCFKVAACGDDGYSMTFHNNSVKSFGERRDKIDFEA